MSTNINIELNSKGTWRTYKRTYILCRIVFLPLCFQEFYMWQKIDRSGNAHNYVIIPIFLGITNRLIFHSIMSQSIYTLNQRFLRYKIIRKIFKTSLVTQVICRHWCVCGNELEKNYSKDVWSYICLPGLCLKVRKMINNIPILFTYLKK